MDLMRYIFEEVYIIMGVWTRPPNLFLVDYLVHGFTLVCVCVWAAHIDPCKGLSVHAAIILRPLKNVKKKFSWQQKLTNKWLQKLVRIQWVEAYIGEKGKCFQYVVYKLFTYWLLNHPYIVMCKVVKNSSVEEFQRHIFKLIKCIEHVLLQGNLK